MRVMKETEARERGRNSHSVTSSKIEIRQKTDLQTWTGVLKKGETVEIALRVFKSSVFGCLNGEGLDDVLENRYETPVRDADADMNELRATIGAEKVARSLRVWNMLIHKITSQSIQQEILACRSPQQAWRVFVNHYSTRKVEESYQLQTQWGLSLIHI